MILAVSVPEKRELVIASADNLDVQRAFLARIQDESPQLLQDTDFSRFLIEADLAGFKMSPTILEFPSIGDLDAFIAANQIELTNFFNAHGKQKAMLAAEEFRKDDHRTLAEINDLVDTDPWDRRTPEEKAKADENRAALKKKREEGKGEITEDSWGGGAGRSMGGGGKTAGAAPEQPDDGQKIVVNDDGSITVENGISVESDDGSPVTNTTPQKGNPNLGGGATGGDLDPDEEKESEGGLRIRDIEIEVDPVTGEVRIGRVVAEKNMFGADMFHISLIDDSGEVVTDETAYQPILKRAGLTENTRYLGWEYKTHEKGGIIIELGGAATLRMEGALTESGRRYTMTAMAEQAEDFNADNAFRISLDMMVETYFRVDVRGHKLDEILPIVSPVKEPYKSNDVDFGCWLAYVRERFADDVIAALATKGITGTMLAVDPEGEALVEEGTEGVRVMDKGAHKEEPPAPWNDRADEYYAMSEEDQKKTQQKLLPFLLYCLRDYGMPTRIIAHITPRSYFNRTGEMWAGDFPFDDLIPDNFVKYGKKVGVYQCKSLDMNTADFTLGNQRHMKESLNLMAHVNSVGVERAED